ncbi:MAG: hypothetical protein GY752_02070 [bacterium]|nr:hypothetical protein [bacterium]MCP4801011.1 hypothetical protein [bacterium]
MKLSISLCMILLLSTPLTARVITVEKDGTGDYQIIQDAVNASAPTDTILIGPGRYEDFWNFRPDLNWDAVVGVTVDSLTIKGVSSDEVTIGPTIPDEHGGLITTHGIASAMDLTWLVVEDIAFDNTDRGVHLFPSGRIRRCSARNIWWQGFLIEVGLDVIVEDCDIYGPFTKGIEFTYYGNDPAQCIARNIRGHDAYDNIYVNHPNVIIEDCESDGNHYLVTAYSGTTYVTRAISRNSTFGFGVHHSNITYNNVSAVESFSNDFVWYPNCIVNGDNVDFSGGGVGVNGVWNMIGSLGEINLHNSNVLKNALGTIKVVGHGGPMDAIDLTNNYWGTTSSDSIDAWIYDFNDRPETECEVQYQPFSDVPLSSTRKTMGGVKALFR